MGTFQDPQESGNYTMREIIGRHSQRDYENFVSEEQGDAKNGDLGRLAKGTKHILLSVRVLSKPSSLKMNLKVRRHVQRIDFSP